LYFTKNQVIKVVGYFQKNDHLYFAENFEEAGFIFAPLKAKKILIPYDQSVKWSTLVTSGEEIHDSDFATENNAKSRTF
jgi:isochorismate synthase